MNAQCKCGTPLELSWTCCPKCGRAARDANQHGEHAERQKNSVPAAFSGLLLGVITAPVLLIFGTLLCLTGLGAFLGVPMIIAALIAPLAGPLIGIGERTVRCPYCKTREITVADSKLHSCPNCEHEFALCEHHQAAKAI
jgi:hypothetical protein